ncbi:threonine-phosphate decarboxylase CobD [uncultured Tateyamaria sp.]|uniref:threonine-phosphate decarboxylase CobD n=1 Tax=uncultured Tateyamaria sp. TaxID=455651 RepID=UPI002614E8B0|nr:threonine-phosphate decarboxylase CobD [uncultured Tateyamaria sp.]
MASQRDHGGGLDAAIKTFGGSRAEWLDLSTGINPVPYPFPALSADAWTALPDTQMAADLTQAARTFWHVPESAEILAAPGASALIAQIPRLAAPATVSIPAPTYNEHAASFAQHDWQVHSEGAAQGQVLVHPNNPDGRMWSEQDLTTPLCIIDESFCDVAPDRSLIAHAAQPGRIVLKSFGKFWGLAGVRLGFAIGDPALIARLRDMLGPWPVSGVALDIGARALNDPTWADQTRSRLAADTVRLDAMVCQHGAALLGGTTLFRLYRVDDANAWQDRLAQHHIWSRIFPYADNWIRLGLPGPDGWDRLEAAL